MLITPLGEVGEMEPAAATAAVPVSTTAAAEVGEYCGGGDCSWYQEYIKQADGSCACQFSIRRAGGMILLAPSVLAVRLIDPKGDKLGWGGINMALSISAITWLGVGWWLWRSAKGGK